MTLGGNRTSKSVRFARRAIWARIVPKWRAGYGRREKAWHESE